MASEFEKKRKGWSAKKFLSRNIPASQLAVRWILLAAIPPILAVSADFIKNIVDATFNDCGIIVENHFTTTEIEKSKNIQRRVLQLHTYGQFDGYARIFVKAEGKCKIEEVNFKPYKENLVLKHPLTGESCKFTENISSSGGFCQAFYTQSDGIYGDDKKAAQQAILVISQFTPQYEYGIEVVLSKSSTQESCDDFQLYFRPHMISGPVVAGAVELGKAMPSKNDEASEHVSCRIQTATFHNYFFRADKTIKLIVILLFSAALMFAFSKIDIDKK